MIGLVDLRLGRVLAPVVVVMGFCGELGEFHAVGGTFHDVISVREFSISDSSSLHFVPLMYMKFCVLITYFTLSFNTCGISTEALYD